MEDLMTKYRSALMAQNKAYHDALIGADGGEDKSSVGGRLPKFIVLTLAGGLVAKMLFSSGNSSGSLLGTIIKSAVPMVLPMIFRSFMPTDKTD